MSPSTPPIPGFSRAWEHVRLLSDGPRNAALVELLRRRAPGASVVEVGCGTGVLSCIAARLGARSVLAIEPTEQAETAQALVERNGLGGQVRVVRAAIEDLPPEPSDLVFSELLNAEPFAEGILGVSRSATRWASGAGHLAPRSLEVWGALVRESSCAAELRAARRELSSAARTYDLDMGPVLDTFADPGPTTFVTGHVQLASEPVCLFRTDLRDPGDPRRVEVVTQVGEPGPVGGVALWFRAELDDDLWLDNVPGASGHWGVHVIAWPEEVGVRQGPVPLLATPTATGFDVVRG